MTIAVNPFLRSKISSIFSNSPERRDGQGPQQPLKQQDVTDRYKAQQDTIRETVNDKYEADKGGTAAGLKEQAMNLAVHYYDRSKQGPNAGMEGLNLRPAYRRPLKPTGTYEAPPGETPEETSRRTGVPPKKLRDTDGDGCYEFNYDDVPPEKRDEVKEKIEKGEYFRFMDTPPNRADGYSKKGNKEIPDPVRHVKEIFSTLGPKPTLAQVREFIQTQYATTYQDVYKEVYKEVYEREKRNGKSDDEAKTIAEAEADKRASDCAAVVALFYMSCVMFTYFNHPYYATGKGGNENYSGVEYDSPFPDEFTPYDSATSPSTDGVKRRQGIIDCDGFAMYIFAVLSGIVDENGNPVFEMHLVHMENKDEGHLVLVVTDKRTGKSYLFDNWRVTEIPEGQSWQDYIVGYYSSNHGFTEFCYYDSPEDNISGKNRHHFVAERKDIL